MLQRLKFHPGETLVLNFTLPFDVLDVKAVNISFRGRDSLAFEATAVGFKNMNYQDDQGNTVHRTRVGYTMNQAETLQFEENAKYKMQLNVYGPNGSRITSKEISVETLEQQLMEPGFSTQSFFYGNGSTTGKGTMDYNKLINKPQVNEVELKGNRTLPEHPISQADILDILSD